MKRYHKNTKEIASSQDKLQNISPIKQNILNFIKCIGISKREFYAKTGISRGTLESNTGITEDTMAKFIAIYPDVSPEWLLTGKGEMLRKNENQNESDSLPASVQEGNEYLLRRFEELVVENAKLKEEIESIKSEMEQTHAVTPTYAEQEAKGMIAAEPSKKYRKEKRN